MRRRAFIYPIKLLSRVTDICFFRSQLFAQFPQLEFTLTNNSDSYKYLGGNLGSRITNNFLLSIVIHLSLANAVAFSPGRQLVASALDENAYAWWKN